MPLTFEVNQGQTDDRVDFLGRGPGYNIFLTATEAVFALPRAAAMRMQLIGSAVDAQAQGLDALPGKANYIRGKDAANWRAGVPIYQRVKYSAVYPGVDLVYYGKSQQLEYDFIVAPGADAGTIKLGFAGVEQTTVDAQGDLVLRTAGGPLRFQKPVIFQIDDGGRRHTIEGGYVHRSPHQIGFRVGAYDRSQPLIIDPVLSYSTYLGGSGIDEGTGIAVDATGAVYVSGSTSSTDFPAVNAMQPALDGSGFDLFVAKLSPDGTALVYATYLGGSNEEGGADIAVDSAGAAYVSALTYSSDFPTVHALQPAKKGDSDTVVVKLSADGSRLIYSTYLGGSSFEYNGASIAVDSAGAAYIAGSTASADFPEVNALQPRPNGEESNAFVAKLAPDGTALLYSTYLGGTQLDSAADIALDSLGAAYIVGRTTSSDFPVVNPVPGTGMPGVFETFNDAFIAKVAPDGASLVYSTYLGGSAEDGAAGVAVDGAGAAYVTGYTTSTDLQTMNALQPRRGGNPENADADAFVVKIAPEGGALIYGTYLGGAPSLRDPDTGKAGSGTEFGIGIAVDSAGAAHVTGITESLDFPTMHPIQRTLWGRRDAFVLKLSPDGASLVYSTYLGGNHDDGIVYPPLRSPPRPFESRMAITVDLAGAAYATGQARDNFPLANALQPVIGGGFCDEGRDAYVLKITDDPLATPAAAATLPSAPTNDSTTTTSQRGGGGGAMDALFLLLLAPLALAGARRRRSGASVR